MAVPFIDLQRFEPGLLDRWAEKCREITANTRFVGGPEVAELERRLSAHCGLPAAIACANGTDALQLALRATGVGPGDRVLVPDATFWATFEAVVNCGAAPVTVDVAPADLQMDFELFRRAVAEYRPKAAILVHLYGWGSARLAEFRAFCRERGIVLVEDTAQGFGVSFNGEPLLAGAEIATLSFYPAKVLGACGDAGAVLCRDEATALRVRQLGNHGRTGHYDHGLVGWNSRMSGFDAAYLNLSLDHVAARLASRREVAALYHERLPALGVEVARPPAAFEENGYLNVCLLPPERRAHVQSVLTSHGIGFGTVYPGSMSLQPGAAGHLAGRVGGEHAARLSHSVLNLPLFAGMRAEEVEEVLAVVADAVG